MQCASSIILKGENEVKIESNSYGLSDRSFLNAGLSHSDELMSSGAQAPDVMKIPFWVQGVPGAASWAGSETQKEG